MEKYAVEQNSETLYKLAQVKNDGKEYCRCGGVIDRTSNVVRCSKGGTACFE